MKNTIEQLKSNLREIAHDQDVISAVTCAFQDGEIIFKDVFGYKNKETYEPAAFDTIYRTGSLSKHVCAIAFLTLFDKGLADLDEDISNYLGYKVRNPYYPDIPITPRMLLSFCATIQDEPTYYKIMIGEEKAYHLSEILSEDGRAYNQENFINAKPGTLTYYANLSTAIIGAIIEKLTKKRFAQYVKEAVFDPLNITASFDQRTFSAQQAKRIASNYDDTISPNPFTREMFGAKWLEKSNANKLRLMDMPLGEGYRVAQGNMHIVPLDLAKIEIALLNQGVYQDIRILSQKAVEEMFTTVIVTTDTNSFMPGDDTVIHQGLVARMYDHAIPGGYRVVEFSGRSFGVMTGAMLCPEKNFGVIICSNGMKMCPFSCHMPKTIADMILATYRYLF